jgi:HPt (histidine-containing phosphotransfer) domain-containing protein
LEEANKSNGVYLKSIFPYIKESLLEGQQELHQHFNNKDIKSINLVAHRLKGTALTASFSKLTILCKELEMTKEFNIEIVQNLLNQIDEELNYLIPIL